MLFSVVRIFPAGLMVGMSEPSRLMLVCISLRGGGTERIVSRLANHFSPTMAVTITTLAAEPPFYTLPPEVNVERPAEMVRLKSKLPRLGCQIAHLYRSLRRHRPNCCLIFGEDIAGITALVARFAGIESVLIFPRGTPGRSLSGLNGVLNPLSARLARFTVVQTSQARDMLTGRYPAGRMRVVPNPISIPEHVTPMQRREKVIINVGSIGRMKNQSGLVRIFSRIAEKNPDWRLWLIGDGPDRQKLQKEVRRLGLDSRVEFRGEQKAVSACLDRARIFAFTSLAEGFPNALAEAMAAGCACISYDCPTGPSELIDHERSGLLVPNGDEEEFAQHLQRLISDEALQTRLSEQAQKDIERFSENRVLEQFDRLITEALNADQARSDEPCDS